MDGSPARWIALIHQLHVAGEEGGSATMVAVFLPVLPVGVVLWLSSRDVTRSSYVAFGTKKNKGGAGAGNILSHIGVHHTIGGRHGRSHFAIFLLVKLARHTRHNSTKHKSDHMPTTHPTKYLRQYLADGDV